MPDYIMIDVLANGIDFALRRLPTGRFGRDKRAHPGQRQHSVQSLGDFITSLQSAVSTGNYSIQI